MILSIVKARKNAKRSGIGRARAPRLWLTTAGLALLLVALLGAPAARTAELPPEPATARSPKPVATAAHEMVVAAHPLATQAGADMLAAGGNAIDAAVAVQLVLGLVEPQSSGLGGGAFLLFWDAAGRALTSYDGRETAPAGAGPSLFLGADGKPLSFFDAVVGGRSVGVPGVPRLLATIHEAHGKLPWSRLFEPAIRLAQDGFPVSPRLAAELAAEPFLADNPAARAYFFEPDGRPKVVGTQLRNPAYAETLKRLATGGARAFYEDGPIARDLVGAVQAEPHPGTLGLGDLASYQAIERPPVCGAYHGDRVCGMGPPSAGGVTVLETLGLLAGFDLARVSPTSVDAAHLLSEAERLAFADRDQYLADPGFVPQPVAALLDPSYLAGRSAMIRPEHSLGRARPGDLARRAGALVPCCAADASPELPSTSHFSVIDRDGNAVAMTTTIENAFGARRMVRGFLLNNQLTDFSFLPERDGHPVANRVEPGKRPRSSMAPTIVLGADGTPKILVGSPGGSWIIPYVVQSLVGMLDWGLDPQAAVDLGHVGSSNGPTELEADTEAAGLRAGLERRGHQVVVGELNSGLHAIARIDGWLKSGVDPRRDGIAIGR